MAVSKRKRDPLAKVRELVRLGLVSATVGRAYIKNHYTDHISSSVSLRALGIPTPEDADRVDELVLAGLKELRARRKVRGRKEVLA